MLSLLLLGSPQVLRDQVPLQLPRRKNRALLFYLAAHEKPLTREHLLNFFFPDHERAAAQQILRTMVYDLRKQLEDGLVVQDELLALAPATFVDTRTFSNVLSSNLQSLHSALPLYRGDFLEGMTLPDEPQFDDWRNVERERYRTLAVRGWSRLAAQYEQVQDYIPAQDALENALALDGLNEDLQRAAMRAQYFRGDRAGAIRRFEQLQKRLDEELGVPPLPETRAVYDAIITDTLRAERRSPKDAQPRVIRAKAEKATNRRTPPARNLPVPLFAAAATEYLLPFGGREAQLQRIEQAAIVGKIIWIEGEPGIGKTRLAEEYIARLPDAAVLVLRAAAHELEASLPYQPIIDALRVFVEQSSDEELSDLRQLPPVWLTELVRLVPELAYDFPALPPVAAPADEPRVWEGLNQVLQTLARKQRVVLLLDDVHWADAATIGFLNYIASRVNTAALTLLVTSRAPAPLSKAAVLLDTLTRRDKLLRLELSGLSLAQLRVVAAQLSPSHADELVAWLMQNTEGNPFFVTELTRYAFRNGILQEDGAVDVRTLRAAPFVPPTIQNLIATRLTRLDENARRVIYIAAVIGREFDFELARQAAGLTEDQVLDALDALRAAGLIVARQGTGLVFDHNLTMDVTRVEMGEPRWRLLHRRIAQALEQIHGLYRDELAGRIARHFDEAGAPERAAPFAQRAGDHAGNLAAWSVAIEFYQLALRGNVDDTARAKIFIAMGDAQFHSANFVQATESYKVALQLARVLGDFPLIELSLHALTQSHFPQGRYAEAAAIAREMLESGPPELAGAAEFAWGTVLAVESAHPIEAEAHLRAAERLLAEPHAYHGQVTPARMKYQLAAVYGQRGSSADAVASYRAALEIAQTDPSTLDTTRTIMLYNNLAYHLHLLGEQTAAAECVRAGLRVAKERGSISHMPYLLSTSGEIALAQGDLDAAEQFLSEGLAEAERTPIPERISGIRANLGLVAHARGQDDLARQRLTDALARADALGNGHLSVRIRIWLAPLLPPADARTRLREARSIAQANGYAGLLEEIGLLEHASSR